MGAFSLAVTKALELRREIIDLVSKEAMVDKELLQPQATLQDLNIDSLDMSMLLMAIEERFDVYLSVDTELHQLVSLEDLIGLLEQKISECGERSDAKAKPT